MKSNTLLLRVEVGLQMKSNTLLLRVEFGLHMKSNTLRLSVEVGLHIKSNTLLLRVEFGLHGSNGILEDLGGQLCVLLGDAHGGLDTEHLTPVPSFTCTREA